MKKIHGFWSLTILRAYRKKTTLFLGQDKNAAHKPTAPTAIMTHHIPSPQQRSPEVQCVIRTIDRYVMISTEERVLVGVSGGPDSMALLHMLHTLAPHYRCHLGVAHVNHGLRPEEAEKDARLVKLVANKFNLPYFEHRAIIRTENGSIEEQAREARYAFFNRVMEQHGYTKIALGHHKNDNAEALLMQLLRGSGTRGLGGIPPVRDKQVVRPLIKLSRSEILSYIKDNLIPFREDASNADTAYERNRIRHHLIPLLQREYNANIIEVLNRTADLCREEETWFSHHLQPLLDQSLRQTNPTHLKLDCRVLSDQPLAVQRRMIRGHLHSWYGHLRRIGANHIDAVIALLPPAAINKKVSLPNGITAVRNPDHLYLTIAGHPSPPSLAQPPSFSYEVAGNHCLPLKFDVPESRCRLTFEIHTPSPDGRIPIRNKNWAWFDVDGLSFPLHIRSFKPGDRISPYGMQGSQKIKKLYIDRKIPAAWRPRIPLLESAGKVLWAIGIRRSNIAAVTDQTRRAMSVRVEWLNTSLESDENKG